MIAAGTAVEPSPPFPPPHGGGRVAYIMSRFPKLTETFVLYEILELEALGVPVEVFPLLRAKQPVAHPEAERLASRAHFHSFLSVPILRAQAHFLFRHPRRYVGTWLEVLRGTAPSLNFLSGALGILPKSVRFAYEMQRLGVTHVHAHFATHPAVAALIVHRLTGIPWSFTAHGSDLHVRRRMLDRKVDAAAFVIAISRFNREIIVREAGESARPKVHVVHCGVDAAVFGAPARRNGSGPLQILCVASFEPVKGHHHLLEACRLLRDRGVGFECHLVGDGPQRRAVEALIRRFGLESQVHMHGPLPREAVAQQLAAAHVFALASAPTPEGKREGIPVVLMEAMASGLPVVATRLSGIPELVEDGITGWLVEPGDAVGFAAALQALDADRGRGDVLGRCGRDKVVREFDLRRNTARLATLFQPAPRAVPEDFTLHDSIRVRVVGASAAERTALAQRFGLAPVALADAPDLTLRWVDALAVRSAPGAADESVILDCERGAGPPAWLRPWLDFFAVERGFVPLPAAAFAWRGENWAVCGDSGAGKTGVLLGFICAGAERIAAETIDLDATGGVHGRAEPIRLRAGHVREFGALRAAVGLHRARRWAFASLPARAWETVPRALRNVPAASGLGAFIHRLERRSWSDLPAATFGVRSDITAPLPLHRVWIVTRGGAELKITPLAGLAALAALTPQLAQRDASLSTLAAALRRARPGYANISLETLAARRQAAFEPLLNRIHVARVEVPIATPLAAVVTAMSDFGSMG